MHSDSTPALLEMDTSLLAATPLIFVFVFCRMLLTDQMSRNAFRGTSEAFAFDDKAIAFARKLYNDEVYKSYQAQHYSFLTTPG